jgi:hypothetical protein
VAVLVAIVCSSGLYAQSGAGSIQGTVTDSTGAVIPGAKIHVLNNATGTAEDSTSNGVGFYQVPALFTGQYTVTITAANMKTYKTGVDIQVAQNVIINATLTAGAITQQVEVAADVVQLTTTDNGTIASTLENDRINQLPMNGRTLITLAGETTPGLEANGTRANGLMGEALEYVADGVPLSNRQFGGMNLAQTQAPDPDSVQEVRVETTNTSAQYSEPGTAIITTKSGTNQLHGSAFETARNNAIGIAKNRNNPANFAAPHLVRNEFGASAGGPIIVPYLYHGKDKSFWFFAYERYSLANPSNEIVDVPTPAFRSGDYSGYTNNAGVFQQLYDPNSTHSDPNCNGSGTANAYCRAPFVNNQIPIGRLSPTMKIIYDITPLPSNTNNPMLAQNAGNSASAGSIIGGNLSAVNPTFVVVPTITFRLDHEFNENNRSYLRYTNNNLTNISLRNYTNTNLNNPTTLAADGLPAEATGIANNPSSQFAAAIGYTHVFSPNFFSETIVSEQWMAQHNFAGGTPTVPLAKVLGTPDNFGEPGFPAFGSGQLLNALWGYGGTQFIYGISQIVLNFDENLTYTHGKHQFQIGGRYRHEHFGWLPDESADNTSFGGLGTSLSLNGSTTPTPNTGGDDPDAFLGNVSSYSVTEEPPYAKFHDMETDGYFQDNWHVSRNLTANLGLRWEDHPATYTAAGVYNSFDLKNDAVILQVPPATLIQEGYTTQAIITNMEFNGAKYETPAQAGVPSTLMNNYPLNFSPRVGIAWQPFGGKYGSVIRGAYGRYIYPMPTRSFIKNPMGNNPLVASYGQNFDNSNQTDGTANAQLRYPQQGAPAVWTQTGTTMSPFLPVMGSNGSTNVNSSTTTSILPGVSLWDNSKAMPPDFVTQLNFTIEQPLKGNAALRLTYLWSHGTNLDHYYYNNNTTASSSQQFLWDMTTDSTASSANGYISTRPYDTTTWGNNTWDVKDGWSNDNAFQINYQRLFHKGVAYQIAYVWSKAFRLGGNYFRDGTVYPGANFLGVLPTATGTSYNTTGLATGGGGTVTTPALPPAPPSGTLPWQEYHKLIYWQEYKPDTAVPFHHVTFNGVVDLPFGRGKRFLGNVNKLADEAVGGWQIAGAGQVVSQAFAPASGNWGATNPIKLYKNSVTVTDSTNSVTQKKKLWFNGFILPSTTQIGAISGLPSGYTVGSASSPAYESPINFVPGTCGGAAQAICSTTNNVNVVGPSKSFNNIAFTPSPSNFGDNPYSRTILPGPFNYNVDLSVFKVFAITERMALRFNADAFNALNIQGYSTPNTTTGEIAYAPNGQSTSYWTPRQIQLTLRLQF